MACSDVLVLDSSAHLITPANGATGVADAPIAITFAYSEPTGAIMGSVQLAPQSVLSGDTIIVPLTGNNGVAQANISLSLTQATTYAVTASWGSGSCLGTTGNLGSFTSR